LSLLDFSAWVNTLQREPIRSGVKEVKETEEEKEWRKEIKYARKRSHMQISQQPSDLKRMASSSVKIDRHPSIRPSCQTTMNALIDHTHDSTYCFPMHAFHRQTGRQTHTQREMVQTDNSTRSCRQLSQDVNTVPSFLPSKGK